MAEENITMDLTEVNESESESEEESEPLVSTEEPSPEVPVVEEEPEPEPVEEPESVEEPEPEEPVVEEPVVEEGDSFNGTVMNIGDEVKYYRQSGPRMFNAIITEVHNGGLEYTLEFPNCALFPMRILSEKLNNREYHE